jgi:putative transposase
MPRARRKVIPGGYYHVLNRGNGRQDLFHKEQDYAAFLAVLAEGLERYPVDLLCYCLMGNHWHLLLRPRTAAGLAELMRWVGVTHVRRHHEHYHTRGGGHVYQGRFRSFPIQDDLHFLTVCRYIEANPLRAKLVQKAEAWPFSSLGQRAGDTPASNLKPPLILADWPVERPRDWLAKVNRPMRKADLDRLHESVNRGRPFGDDRWVAKTAARLGLGNTLRNPGRPPGKARKPGRSKKKNQ